MALADLQGWLEDDALDIPVPGHRTFRVPSPDAETGVRLSAIFNAGLAVNRKEKIDEKTLRSLQMDDAEERDFLGMVLGSAYAEMLAEKVSWTRIQRVGRYVFLHHAAGPEAAAAYVKEATRGEAPAPNRASRRASSDTAPKTRPRGSTGSTNARKPKRTAA
jgi:hypothetical protein